jgi:hypothetical protein
MQRALGVIVEDFSLTRNRSELARRIGVSRSTVCAWFTKAPFREWWNQCLVSICRTERGPVTLRLLEILDSGCGASVKVKAIETFLRHVGPSAEQNQAAALLSIIEKYQGKARIRVAAEVLLEPAGEGAPGSDNGGYVPPPAEAPEPQVIPAADVTTPEIEAPAEAMQASSSRSPWEQAGDGPLVRSIDQAAQGEVARQAGERVGEPPLRDGASSLPLPPAVPPPAELPTGGGGSESRPPAVSPHATHAPNGPKTPPGSRLDPWGRPYRPKERRR